MWAMNWLVTPSGKSFSPPIKALSLTFAYIYLYLKKKNQLMPCPIAIFYEMNTIISFKTYGVYILKIYIYIYIGTVRTVIWTSAHQEHWMIAQQDQNNVFVWEWVLQENFLCRP